MEAVRFWMAFGLAVAGLHGTWQAARLAWVQPQPERWLVAAGWLAVLVVSAAWAGYLLYAADRRAGRVRRRVAVYERWLAFQRGGRWP
ncbi:MAG: hypothetical protein QN166_09330 [Armatimonadota bacterium]|nr:hypothetical protein [Armatimonadota bacterium]MDR7447224.1 hypothetical protein [Armatimonadota bacterium]